MDPVEWYSVILGAIVGVALLIFVIVTLAECVKGPLFRSKTRRQVGALAIWIGPDVLLFLLFLAANIVPIVYDIKDADTFIRNSARITIAGLVPLSLGGHISPIPNAIRFRFDTFAKCHRWLGRLTIIEGIVHVTAAWWLHPPDTRTPSIIAGFIALAIFAVTLLALPIRWMWEFLLGSCFRVSFSEIFLASHQWFCVAAMVAIYAHAPSHSFTKSSSIFLLCAGAVQITVLLTRLDNLVRRNVKAGKFLHVAKLKDMQLRKKPVQDSVEIHIPLRRGWTLEAGQYVYFRGHPFYISQWYTEKDHEFIEKDDEFIGKAKDFIVLVVEKKGGFTSRLYDKCGWTKALLEGPYGKRLDLWNVGNGAVNQASDKYSDVIFFATGIGLVGQLPYINEILASSKSTRVRVFWEIDRTGHAGWFREKPIENILEGDGKTMRFKITIHILDQSHPTEEKQDGERVRWRYAQPMDVKSILLEEEKRILDVAPEDPSVALLLCTDAKTTRDIWRAVAKLSIRVNVAQLEFHPPSLKGKQKRRCF